ncbi:hypothetical protein [Streptomyces sp. WAC07061]|uniref:hypothetical protein n=1 Tax=Streptomyces sp. WAC07061 TaxID=2487410 RepID=UPI00163BBBFE|nr:hypothetical protein [Streptomyces sp. WAC07061]
MEICRALGDLESAPRWSRQADVMPVGVYTRAIGIPRAVLWCESDPATAWMVSLSARVGRGGGRGLASS